MAKTRHRQLDQIQKKHILAIVSIGGSRQFAAQYVGCTLETIRRELRRDVAFAAALRQTECQTILSDLKNLQIAARQERHWRAAVWSLERRHPQEFAPRPPDTLTNDQLRDLLKQIVQILIEAIPVPSIRKNVVKRLALLLKTLGRPVSNKWHAQPERLTRK